MATLDDAGFDPSHLATDKAADRYLSRAPAAPTTDKLKVTAAASPATSSASFAAIAERVGQPDLRSAMVECWQKYTDATKGTRSWSRSPIKAAYSDSGYDDEPGSFSVKLDRRAAPREPRRRRRRCVRAARRGRGRARDRLKDGFQT